jgi:hypothetical protein
LRIVGGVSTSKAGAPAIAIAWGDLAAAWFSTGIPNIETYVKVPFAVAIGGRNPGGLVCGVLARHLYTTTCPNTK